MKEVLLGFTFYLEVLGCIKILLQNSIVAGKLVIVGAIWQVLDCDAFDFLAVVFHQKMVVENQFCARYGTRWDDFGAAFSSV